jgi:hypothetical protein
MFDKPVTVDTPIPTVLLAVIKATQATGLKAWLIGARGGSFTNQGFTVWFGADIAKAGLPARCTPHGLRKRCPLDIVSTTPAARR